MGLSYNADKSNPDMVFSILIVGIYYLMHMIFKVPMPEGIFNFILLTAVLLDLHHFWACLSVF